MKQTMGRHLWIFAKTALLSMLFITIRADSDPRTTRQILIDSDTTLTTCCANTENNFIGTFTSLALISGSGGACSPTLISQANVGTTGFVINQPGVYQLSQSIVFSPAAAASAITINTHDVQLNLLCYSIEQGNSQAGVNGASISTTFSNVIIMNGSIGAFTGDAIHAAAGTSNIAISNMKLLANAGHGVNFNGSNGSPINNIQISTVEFLANGTGVTSQFVQLGAIDNCSFFNQAAAGIELINSYSHSVKSCIIADTVGTADVRGISAVGGGNNLFQGNLIDNTSTTATSSSNAAIGILIGSTENNDIINNNAVTNSLGANGARAFDIAMAYTFTALSSSNLPTIADGTTAVSTVNSIAWSSNGRFLATGSGNTTGGSIGVSEFTGLSLMLIATTAQTDATSVSWSPDASFLAVGNGGTTPAVTVYAFNNAVSLTPAASTTFASGNNVNSIDWSSDGRFIAAGLTTANQVSILQFTAIADTITTVTVFAPTGVSVTSVSWSPDVLFLAVGNTTQVIVYSFNGIALTQVAAFTHGAVVNSVQWSPDGRYIVMGGVPNGGVDTRVLNFTGSALNQVASFSHGASVQSVQWSQDEQYVLLGGATSGGFEVQALQFLGNALSLVASFANGTQVNSVAWAPTGAVVAIGGVPNATTGVSVRILTGLQFGSGTIIRNNLITFAQGAALAAGAPGVSNGKGMLASSAANLIIQNLAYHSDINYTFVTDVFKQYVANTTASTAPSLIANLSFPPL